MCGIFGIINHHKRQLDKRAFITLGCANDSRGGDACGIMIDHRVEKGTKGDDQYFQCWYPKSQVLKETEKCYVALGHCRKASVGGVAPEKAQPITIHDNDGNMLFCLIHNGTIYNYKELAEKYIPDVKIEGMTDSQVMANIFFYRGYDVLSEYNGGGAFVIQDYRINKTYIFKGESKLSATATKTEAERPLYFVSTGKSVIFSSMFAVLQGLYWGFDVYDVPTNTLLECDGEALYKVKEYDRSKCTGYRTYVSTSTNLYENFGYSYTSSSTGSPTVDFDISSGQYYNSQTHELLHGMIYVSTYGYISTFSTGYNKPYYFWRGIMVSGENAYNALRDQFAAKMDSKSLLNLARRLSCNPVMINKRYYTYTSDYKKVCYEDEYVFPLSDADIVCGPHGKVIVAVHCGTVEQFIPVNLSVETVKKIVDYVKTNI